MSAGRYDNFGRVIVNATSLNGLRMFIPTTYARGPGVVFGYGSKSNLWRGWRAMGTPFLNHSHIMIKDNMIGY